MIINLNHLKNLKNDNITMCSGWFDMFHVGHLNFLNNAKKQSEKLLVVVRNDIDGRHIKGKNRPIINEHQRAQIIDNLKCVDYVLISGEKVTVPHIPDNLKKDKKTLSYWEKSIPIIKSFRPKNVFALEETLKFNGLGGYIESLGVNIIYSERFEGISTTDIEKKLNIEK